MAKAKPRFNPNEAAARMFISTQVEQDTHDAQSVQDTQNAPQVQEVQSEPSTQDAHDTQPASITHGTQDAQPVQSAHDTHDTQKTQRAQKHPRINMAFYGDNLEFVREEAWRNKQSITEYVNSLIEQARNK